MQRIDLPNEAADRGEHFDARIDLPNEAADQGEPDILSAVVDEVFSGDITSVNETPSVNEADNIIQEIMNDLEQDEALRGILNQVNDINEFVQPHYQDEDEGIGLNLETELEDIIEPFDYELEVEGFDF